MAARSGTNGAGHRPAAQADVAAYVASLSADLSTLSRRNGLTTLAYLLDMARLEADQLSRRGQPEGGAPASDPGVELP